MPYIYQMPVFFFRRLLRCLTASWSLFLAITCSCVSKKRLCLTFYYYSLYLFLYCVRVVQCTSLLRQHICEAEIIISYIGCIFLFNRDQNISVLIGWTKRPDPWVRTRPIVNFIDSIRWFLALYLRCVYRLLVLYPILYSKTTLWNNSIRSFNIWRMSSLNCLIS